MLHTSDLPQDLQDQIASAKSALVFAETIQPYPSKQTQESEVHAIITLTLQEATAKLLSNEGKSYKPEVCQLLLSPSKWLQNCEPVEICIICVRDGQVDKTAILPSNASMLHCSLLAYSLRLSAEATMNLYNQLFPELTQEEALEGTMSSRPALEALHDRLTALASAHRQYKEELAEGKFTA